MKPFIIGISGGSGSGKTTLVEEILKNLESNDILVIKHDDYYKDQSDMSMEKRVLTNYDHPNSLDNELLFSDLKKLIDGNSILMPIYDFVNHTRSKETKEISPRKIIILEGILSIENKQLRSLMDLMIFVDCDLDEMFIRRLKRDIESRGRTMESVLNQYLKTVKPMYYKYVKPSKRHADVIVLNHDGFKNAIDLLVIKIKSILYK